MARTPRDDGKCGELRGLKFTSPWPANPPSPAVFDPAIDTTPPA